MQRIALYFVIAITFACGGVGKSSAPVPAAPLSAEIGEESARIARLTTVAAGDIVAALRFPLAAAGAAPLA